MYNVINVNDVPECLYKILILSSENDHIITEYKENKFILMNYTKQIKAEIDLREEFGEDAEKINNFSLFIMNYFKDVKI